MSKNSSVKPGKQLELNLPNFSKSSDTWGPSDRLNDLPFGDLPFAPFVKSQTINYIADWTPSFGYYDRNRNRNRDNADNQSEMAGGAAGGLGGATRGGVGGGDDTILGDFSDNDNDFHVVRTRKYEDHKGRKDWTAHRAKMAEAHEKIAKKEIQRLENAPQSKYRPKQQILRRKRRKKMYENPRPAIPSIKKQDSWQLQTDLWFNSMLELQYRNIPIYENGTMSIVTRGGQIHRVRRDFDTIRCRTPSPLLSYKYSDNRFIHFDYVSASNDSFLIDMAKRANELEMKRKSGNNNNNNNNNNEKWKVYTTDTIMALLMCIIRSKYSFDIVITKIGKNIFLDQRGRLNSYWHVDETSQNRPTKKGTANMNKYTNLMKEATLINHVLSEQLVSHKLENIYNLEKKHPFSHSINGGGNNNTDGNTLGATMIDNDTPGNTPRGNNVNDSTLASKAFVYKTFDLIGRRLDDELMTEGKNAGNNNSNVNEEKTSSFKKEDDIRIYARCCAHGFDGHIGNHGNNRNRNLSKKAEIPFINIYGLNQYDHLKSKTKDWNKELDQQLSGILLTEITNNSFKMARWAMESYLVGCERMKIGFVTRVKPQASERDHQIVGVKTFYVNEMLQKCNIFLRHEWSILKHIIQIIQTFEFDGRYICIRDPLKQVIRFYKCDDNAFGKDDELPSTKQIIKSIIPAKNDEAAANE